jgi:hypothetical protein
LKPSESIPKIEKTKRNKDDQTIHEIAHDTGLGESQSAKWARDMVQAKRWTRYKCNVDGRVQWVYHVEK